MDIETISVLLNQEATIIRFKDSSCITGYTSDIILGKNWFDIFITDVDKKEVLEVFASFFSETQSPHWSYDNRIECKDGTKKLLNFKNKTVKNSSGKTEFIFCVAKETDYNFLSADDI